MTLPRDRFGFPEYSITLFERGKLPAGYTGWVTLGYASKFIPPAPKMGETQFNHAITFEAANELQILRDLSQFTDGSGRRYFDIWQFEYNGRQLPVGAGPELPQSGVLAFSNHYNGGSHTPWTQALKSPGWFGQINEQWKDIRNGLIHDNPNATPDQMKELLKPYADSYKSKVDERVAAAQMLTIARIDNDGVYRSAININTGEGILNFDQYIKPTVIGPDGSAIRNPDYDPMVKTATDLASRHGLFLDTSTAMPFTRNGTLAAANLNNLNQALNHVAGLMDGSSAIIRDSSIFPANQTASSPALAIIRAIPI